MADGVGDRQSGGLSDEDSNDGRSGCTSTDACTERTARGGFRSEALGPIDEYSSANSRFSCASKARSESRWVLTGMYSPSSIDASPGHQAMVGSVPARVDVVAMVVPLQAYVRSRWAKRSNRRLSRRSSVIDRTACHLPCEPVG